MKAAVVTKFSEPPQYGDFMDTQCIEHEELITVTASAQSQLVRAVVSGRHYSSPKAFPFVAGVDGIGRRTDGTRVYFSFPRAPFGAMAEVVPIAKKHYALVPDNLDDITAAAIANPAMSSWAALLDRARLQPGETVLVNGATGVSGRLAIQIARHLGAGRVIATGRNRDVLESLLTLGADAIISLTAPLDELVLEFRRCIAEHDVRIVLDYLWGEPADALIRAIAARDHAAAATPIRFVQIGGSAAPALTLSASSLRSTALELMGSGLGSVELPRLVEIIGAALNAVVPAGLKIEAQAVALRDVAAQWNAPGSARQVFVP